MLERLAADKKQKIQRTHADVLAALQSHAVVLTDEEATRLHEKLSAYIQETNAEDINTSTIADVIAERFNDSPQARTRWFGKESIVNTLEEHARKYEQKQRIDRPHSRLIAALSDRGLELSASEALRLREKLSAYIAKSNPEQIDIATMYDAIAEKSRSSLWRSRRR